VADQDTKHAQNGSTADCRFSSYLYLNLSVLITLDLLTSSINLLRQSDEKKITRDEKFLLLRSTQILLLLLS
jgi:hypothetical protein